MIDPPIFGARRGTPGAIESGARTADYGSGSGKGTAIAVSVR